MGFLKFNSRFLRIPTLCVLLLAASPAQSNAIICDTYAQLRSWFRKDKPFDGDSYRKQVQEFEKAILENNIGKIKKLSPVDQIALMEALSKSKGRNPLDLADLLQRDPYIRDEVLNIAKKIKSKNGYRLSNLNQTFDELFEVIHPKFNDIPLLKLHKKKNQVIDRWIGHELGRRDLETAARNLGILKNENAVEKFRLWKQRNSNAINLSINGSLNTASLRYMGVPGALPKIKFFRANEELIKKIEKQGLEAIKPELYAHYKNPAVAQLVYESLKKKYISAFKAIAMYYVYQHWSEIKGQTKLVYNIGKNSIESLFLSDEDLQKQVDQTFSLDQAQEEEIINTLQTLAEEQNGKLSPNDIWNQVKMHLELTAQDLKPNFTGKKKNDGSDQKQIVTEQDIISTSMKILKELVDEKTLHPSVFKNYQRWIENRKKQ